MRLRCVVFVLSALVVSACDGGSSSDDSSGVSVAERRDAIQRVALSLKFGNPSGTPPPDGDYACTIYGGGPPPGMQTPGTCRWDAERDGDAWIVSDMQTWKCVDFSGIGEAGGPCTGEFGSHSWRHRVDGNGEITYLGRQGQFPPSLAE